MAKRKPVHYPSVELIAETLVGRLDFESIFGRCAPLHIEIGSGRGAFVICEAQAYPDTDFVAVEWGKPFCRHIIDRAGRRALTNVRVVRAEAAQFVRDRIPDGCVSCFHIYFPDPWPKKRHNKRRFVNLDNLGQMLRCLKSGGSVNLATDHLDYYQQMVKVVQTAVEQGTMEPAAFIRPAGAGPFEQVGTNYERKYIRQGRTTYTLAARKR